MSDNRPIGIFDSGIGGLTVANAVLSRLPSERIIYFGDTAHLPYGDKSAQAIRNYATRITEFLLEKDCKAIVIACNSASSAAYLHLVRQFGEKIPVANVIDPVVEHVATRRDLNTIGVIGTKATTKAGAYPRKLKKLAPDLEVRSQATPLLAQMVEEGFFNNNISRAVINGYLSKSRFEGIEGLILACTHYPLIRDDIDALYASRVEIFDTMGIVADSVTELLRRRDLLASEASDLDHEFYVSDYTESFEETTRIFWGRPVQLKQADIWD